jgi:MFS family permease
LAAYPVGTWIDHGHGRRVMVCGTVLAAAMLALWSQAHSLITLFVVWIGLGVAMAATLYDPVFAVITRDFPRSFRTKITLVTLVAGFASTVFIPLTQVLVDRLQWRDALLALAGFNPKFPHPRKPPSGCKPTCFKASALSKCFLLITKCSH